MGIKIISEIVKCHYGYDLDSAEQHPHGVYSEIYHNTALFCRCCMILNSREEGGGGVEQNT